MVITQQVTSNTIKVAAEQFFDHVEVTEEDIFIYFPELTITNELDLSIDIKGLLIEINYVIEDSNLSIICLKGGRTEYNLCQFVAGYSHSHLPVGNRTAMRNFCLGSSTPIANIISNGEVVEDLDYFFGLVNAFVRNESISGVPHIKLEMALDIGRAVSNLLRPPSIMFKDVIYTAKKMTEADALEYNYVKAGILPKISIKAGDDELLDECLLDCNLGVSTADITVLDLLKRRDDEMLEHPDGFFYREMPEMIGEGSIEYDHFRVIPTQEELEFLSINVQAGGIQRNKMYNELEYFLNKILNA
tara:strand:- start:1286 stop:2194 length:909 start_codon:yes stop_codon:yes gene_type:complete